MESKPGYSYQKDLAKAIREVARASYWEAQSESQPFGLEILPEHTLHLHQASGVRPRQQTGFLGAFYRARPEAQLVGPQSTEIQRLGLGPIRALSQMCQ
jgi:hypothetical protein